MMSLVKASRSVQGLDAARAERGTWRCYAIGGDHLEVDDEEHEQQDLLGWRIPLLFVHL